MNSNQGRLTVAPVIFEFVFPLSSSLLRTSQSHALRVSSCKTDGFRSKDIYCLNNIMNNKTECELYTPIHLSFYRSLVFWRFKVHIHLQSLSSPLFANLYAFIILPIPKLSSCILTYSFISTSYQHSSRFFTLFTFYSLSFSLSICTLHLLPGHTTSSNLQSACASSCLSIRRSFWFLFMTVISSLLSCAFTLELTRSQRGEMNKWPV